ncbi:hypothetical protein [Polaribacter sp. Q13]|uniref:hypothetical protein n=1 Tax=Polaribacter sp. Q13 TaxID=2806551 RepID=UPI00193C2BE5|nr:hypothetical protein [Polaribacter sp. Q13]QVY66352.1 hypothetical protein JOP69_03410 [Polaribacter sp. Q13]
MMNKLKHIVIALAIGLITSCSSDDDSNTATDNATYAMFIVTDSSTGSGLLVPFNELPTGEIDVATITNGTQLTAITTPGISYDGAIYNSTNSAGDPGIQKFSLSDDNTFFADGFITTNGNFAKGNMFEITSSTKGYYSNSDVSQTALQIFNPETMERTGEIDCATEIDAIKSELTDVATTSFGGFLVERDGKIYTQVFFSDESGYDVVDKTYVAIIDTTTDTLDKIIVWDDFIVLGYGFKNTNYINFDENNNLYLGGLFGNFTDAEGPNFRVLRIKDGETDFDTSWDINALRDFSNGENFGIGGAVVNDKMYIKMFGSAISSSFEGVANLDYYSYEIDLTTKEATKISDIPVGYWKSVSGPSLIDDKPYLIVENDDVENAYFYSYDTATKTSTKEITIIGGSPTQFLKL